MYIYIYCIYLCNIDEDIILISIVEYEYFSIFCMISINIRKFNGIGGFNVTLFL